MFDHSLKIASAALLGCVVVSSCQDYEPNADLIMEKATVHNYDKAFREAFTDIDPNQNWGFDLMPVCGDDVDVTRSVNTNSNQWESHFNYVVPGGIVSGPWGQAPGDITNYERAYVYWWFSTHQWPEPIPVNWSEFFIECVWGQPEHSQKLADASAYPGDVKDLGMNNMKIILADKTPPNSPCDDGKKINSVETAILHCTGELDPQVYEHINDFNASGAMKEQIMYLYDVSTKDFYYEESRGSTDKNHNNWTIQYINGNYYLAFDYWSQKKNQNGMLDENYAYLAPDGYYNDWIFKIQNGVHKSQNLTRRVMCEDLGNTYDWDFNDLVFDVTIFNGDYGNGDAGYYARITLQAAGGTLPIYIGKKESAYEAHFLFGVETNTPVNVDAPTGVKRAAVVFYLPLYNDWNVVVNDNNTTTINFNNIPIIVDRSSKSESDNYAADELGPMNPSASGDIVLSAVVGEAPQKFACRNDTYWMKEQEHISTGHIDFAEWVAGQKTEEETFVTSEKVYGNPPEILAQPDLLVSYFYADNGKPYAGSHGNTDSETEIKEWKTLWSNKDNAEYADVHANADVNAYTEVRSYPTRVNPNGSPNTSHSEYTTYSTTFEAQAPFIYETTGENDDPIAYSVLKMDVILQSSNINEEIEWTPNAHKVTLETESQNEGYVLGTGYYHNGANVVITAVPRSGKRVVKWVEVDSNNQETTVEENSATYTIENLTSDKKYKAYFDDKEKKYVNFKFELVEGATDNPPYGSILSDEQHNTVDGWEKYGPLTPDVEYDFVAKANSGYVFHHWSYTTPEGTSITEYDNMISVTLDKEDVYITAYYRNAVKYTLTLNVNNTDYGTVSGAGLYDEGSFVTAEATPNTGYRFVSWTNTSNEIESYLNPYQFYIEGDTELTANFEPIVITISTTREGETPPAPGTQNQLINGNGTVDEYSNFLASLTSEQGFYQGYELRTSATGLTGYTECCLEVEYLNGGQITFNNGTDTWLGMESYTPTTGTVTQYAKITDITSTLTLQNGAARIRKIVIWVKP